MEPIREERSIPQLFGDSLVELAKIMENELDLARAELREKFNIMSRAATLMGAGATLLIPGFVLILFAIAAELIELGLPAPVAYLCSGIGATIIALALVWVGLAHMSAGALKPSATLDQFRRDKNMAKELMR